MDGSEHIKKRTARIRGEVQALRLQLQPSLILPANKHQAQTKRQVQPPEGSTNPILQTSRKSGYAPARNLQRDTARKQQRCIQVKNRRQRKMPPIHRRTLAHDQRAGEGGKHHGDARQPHPNTGPGSRGGRILYPAQISRGWYPIASSSVP